MLFLGVLAIDKVGSKQAFENLKRAIMPEKVNI